MSEANKAVVRRWFDEVWNQGRESSIHELFSTAGIAHGLGDSEQDVRGPLEFATFFRNIRGSLPDIKIAIDDILAEGERVALRITMTGTHTGEGLGVPPSGNKVRVQGVIIIRVVDGQLVEAWNSYDQLGLLRQIGALPLIRKADTFLSAPS